MKKQRWGMFVLWVLVIAVIAGGIFLAYRHLGGGNAERGAAAAGGGVDSAMQTFSGDGYSLGVPASWRVEQEGKDVIAAYDDPAAAAASSTESCKIEMSVFPYVSSTSVADWISGRIGADPSLAIVEQSSGDVAISGGSGVTWSGTIDGVPTTLVYAFSNDHAYEIAPSVVNAASAGNTQCAAALETFLSQLTIK